METPFFFSFFMSFSIISEPGQSAEPIFFMEGTTSISAACLSRDVSLLGVKRKWQIFKLEIQNNQKCPTASTPEFIQIEKNIFK